LVKTRETNRYLDYLGLEPQVPAPAADQAYLSRGRVGAALIILTILALLGVLYGLARHTTGDTLARTAQTDQNALEDEAATSPLFSGGPVGSIEACDDPECWNTARFSAECVGWWYPILLGITARSGE
jgi:hypothetical protein